MVLAGNVALGNMGIDTNAFTLLELYADGFRNYFDQEKSYKSPSEMLVDKTGQLTLTVPEMKVWEKSSTGWIYQGLDRKTGQVKWSASSVDLLFGSNSELRAVAEVYTFDTSEQKFVDDFLAAWNKVMNLGRQ